MSCEAKAESVVAVKIEKGGGADEPPHRRISKKKSLGIKITLGRRIHKIKIKLFVHLFCLFVCFFFSSLIIYFSFFSFNAFVCFLLQCVCILPSFLSFFPSLVLLFILICRCLFASSCFLTSSVAYSLSSFPFWCTAVIVLVISTREEEETATSFSFFFFLAPLRRWKKRKLKLFTPRSSRPFLF